VRKVPAALVLSILITTVVALILQVQPLPDTFTVTPDFSTLGDFDVTNVFSTLGLVAALLTIFSFMLTDFFDTMGTATAIVEQAGQTDADGSVPGVGRLLLVDSVAAAAGGAAGISSNTSYIESAAGVAEGGRTGLTAVVVGALFLVAILLSPLALLVPFVATAPVLVVVGYLMATLIKDIDFADLEEGFPALLTLILMPLTFSITIGIGAGFITWVLIKVALGKVGQIHPLMWLVAIAFVIFFAQALFPGGISA
jgi:AGZA family xanthine/uracil permease-like MFS transporter